MEILLDFLKHIEILLLILNNENLQKKVSYLFRTGKQVSY